MAEDWRLEARVCLEVARRAFKRQLSYRGAAVAGLATNLFFGVLRFSVLVALFGARDNLQGYSLPAAISYTGLTQGLVVLLSIFGWYELMNTVYRGEIANDLLRPSDYFLFWLSQDAGRAAAQLLLRTLPILGLYALLFRLEWPQQPLVALFSLVLAWLCGFAFRFLVNLAAFWSPDARGIGRLAFTLMMFATGFLMPLRFFPDWLQTLLNFTPFPSMLSVTIEIWLGLIQGAEAMRAVAVQLVWCAALIAASRIVFALGSRRLMILGG